MFARITGVGSHLPGAPISNTDLMARGVDTNDDWVVGRTGIKTRHFAPAGVTASDLAFEACRKALASAGTAASEIDLIIVATSTPDLIFPSTACLLQAKLGNQGAMAFDIQAVCTGFVYALSIAEKFIRSGSHKKALVVGADVFSRILDWQDRTTCVLFGDGAGAVVLAASDEPGILASVNHADGAHQSLLAVPGSVSGGQVTGDPFLRMDGPAVFKFAVGTLAEVAIECCALAGLSVVDIDWLIPHQANIRIIESTGKRLGLPMAKTIATVERHGNTSAASIPLALDAAVQDGRVKRGHKLVLEGIGGGFTWGAVLLQF